MIVAILVEELHHFLRGFGGHIRINTVSPRSVDGGDVPMHPRPKHLTRMNVVHSVHFCVFGTRQSANPSHDEVLPFGTTAPHNRQAHSKYQTTHSEDLP
jgi:hypothetical protein